MFYLTPRGFLLLLVAALFCAAPAALAQGAEPEPTDDGLPRCDAPVGTLAVVEPQEEILEALEELSLQSPTGLIRMMVQESNCFVVVERGAAMRNLMQERELAASGQLQQDENVGGGQLKAADFIMTPEILFSEGNAGGVGGAVGGLLGRRSRAVGALAGGLKFKEAQTSLLVADTRSGIQVAAAQGKAKKADFSLGALAFAGGAGMAGGGYTNTNEGKVIAASFLDNYAQIVAAVRSNPELQQRRADASAAENATAGAVFAEGDLLRPKIDNVPLLAAPSADAEVKAQLAKTLDLLFTGREQDGFVEVMGAPEGEGWVKAAFVQKQ